MARFENGQIAGFAIVVARTRCNIAKFLRLRNKLKIKSVKGARGGAVSRLFILELMFLRIEHRLTSF